MQKFKLSQRELVLMAVTIGVTVVVSYYNLALVPKWDEIGKLKDRLAAARIELKVSQEKMKILEKVKGALQEPRMPGETRQEKALAAFRHLSYATAKAGLKLITLKPQFDPNSDRLNFTLSCSGKYKDFYEFVKILSKFKVVILIDDLKISGGGEKDPRLDLQMQLTAIL